MGKFNSCMRTGLKFAFRKDGPVQTGDLFLLDDGLQIRGVPDGEFSMKPEVVIRPCALTRREEGSPYSDSDVGHVHILECSDEFRKFVAEWSPAMAGYLPELPK